MSLLLVAAAAGAGLVYLFKSKDKEVKAVQQIKAKVAQHEPDSGRFQGYASTQGLTTGGQVVRSYKDTDLRGVPCTFNDYGSGSYTRTYAPANLSGGSGDRY